jgi:hypothetical protein
MEQEDGAPIWWQAFARSSSCPKGTVRSAAMRLLVARCEVVYTGRLSTVLPEATRLLMFKDDGSFLVHEDAGGYKPLNWIRSVFRPELLPNPGAYSSPGARFATRVAYPRL